jgi:hypothetical protein
MIPSKGAYVYGWSVVYRNVECPGVWVIDECEPDGIDVDTLPKAAVGMVPAFHVIYEMAVDRRDYLLANNVDARVVALLADDKEIEEEDDDEAQD